MANKSLGPRFQNFWIRAWCSNDSGAIFTKKILRLTLIVSYIELFILIFFVPHQNDIATTKLWSKAGWTGQGRKFFLQTPKSKIDKNHSYAIFPYENNNHIFYDCSEINQKGPPVRKTWLKWTKKNFFTQRHIISYTLFKSEMTVMKTD